MTLTQVLQRFATGEATAEESAGQVRELCLGSASRPATTDETLARMAGALDERDPRGTFLEVSAAWSAGLLSDEQYAVLYEAVAGRPFATGGDA